MLSLFDANIQSSEKTYLGLCQLYGIGKKTSFAICEKLGITKTVKVKELSLLQIQQIQNYILESCRISNDLKKDIQKNRQRYIKIKSYIGSRYLQNLPVRGQRTHGNAKTSRKLLWHKK